MMDVIDFMEEKLGLYSFSAQDVGAVAETDIKMLPMVELHDFEGHPFKVEHDMALFELMRSIESEGVIVPALARPKVGGGYELIAGHRRKAAGLWAGLTHMPVVIRNLDDNQAVIAMVDSNLQREHLKPSEKAFAYKMKLEAMKRQGARTDLTSDQVEPMLDNPTVVTHRLKSNYDEQGNWCVVQGKSSYRSNELLARQIGESVNQIKRYIRLSNLIPKILDMVDEGKIAFTVAVELSYLTAEQQYELYEVMNIEQCTPSLSQANRMKRLSQSGELEMDLMFQILEQEKPNQREVIKIPADVLQMYILKEYTPREKVEYKAKKVKSEPEMSKADIRIIEDIHAMKDAQRKRLMKYIEALKQIEVLEDME